MLYCKQINLHNKNDSLSKIYGLIPARAKILDIGCATGSLATALNKNKKCHVVGLEFNPQSVAICRKSGAFAKIIQYDMNNFDVNDFPKYLNFFDYIVCADVLEHLLQPEKSLNELKKLLQKNGKMIISLPNIAHASIKTNLLLNDFTYTKMGILDKTHLHFYTYKNIAQLLSQCNLKIIKASSVNMPADGWQPHKISELPPEIANFILKDKHSHIMQYIMLCTHKKTTVKENSDTLNALSKKVLKPGLISIIKRIIMLKMPKLIDYIEQFKK